MLVAFDRLQPPGLAQTYSSRYTKSPSVKRYGSMLRYFQYITTRMPRVAKKRKTGMKMVYHSGATELQKVSVTQKAPTSFSNRQQEIPPLHVSSWQFCIAIFLFSDYNFESAKCSVRPRSI